jgi:acyl carrier protein
MGEIMTPEDAFTKVVQILVKYSKAGLAPDQIKMETNLLNDLKINSARLVDIILDLEDTFNIRVEDSEADNINTVGDSVKLILSKL